MRFLQRIAKTADQVLDLIRDIPHNSLRLDKQIDVARRNIASYKDAIAHKSCAGDGQGRFEKGLDRAEDRLKELLAYKNKLGGTRQLAH